MVTGENTKKNASGFRIVICERGRKTKTFDFPFRKNFACGVGIPQIFAKISKG